LDPPHDACLSARGVELPFPDPVRKPRFLASPVESCAAAGLSLLLLDRSRSASLIRAQHRGECLLPFPKGDERKNIAGKSLAISSNPA